MNNYALLADITAITHAAILVGLVIGLLISYRYKRFRPIEAACFIIVILGWSYFGNCPFVVWEQHFRDLAGQHVDISSIGFIPYYAHKFFGIDIPGRIVQRVIAFTGGMLFAGSIELFAPFFHMEVFKVRKTLRKLARNYSI